MAASRRYNWKRGEVVLWAQPRHRLPYWAAQAFVLCRRALARPAHEHPSPQMEAWRTRIAVSWVQALAARLVPSLVSSLLVPGLVPGLVSSVIATLAPLRHASNLGGPFNLCSLLSAVSLGPPEGATTHDSMFN